MPSKKTDTYDEFVDKFRVKKTTDDCYTPDNIYEVVALMYRVWLYLKPIILMWIFLAVL